MDSGREQNYWPGFVDALSNVVLTLVFVLVIFVFALVLASSKVSHKVDEIVEAQKHQQTQEAAIQAARQENASEVASLQAQLTAAKAELEKLKQSQTVSASVQSQRGVVNESAVTSQAQDKHIDVENNTQGQAKQGDLQITHAVNTVVLNYPPQVTEIDDKSAAALSTVVNGMKRDGGRLKILLRAIVGQESYSAARRLAYYRALGARNYFITKMGQAPADISTVIVQPPKPEDGRVEVVFQKQ
jgi:hypothetical protein